MNNLQRKPLFLFAGTLLFNLLFFSSTNVIAQSEDAYLKALEAEAEAISAMPVTGEENNTVSESDQSQKAADNKFQSQKEAFEKHMQQTLPSTFTIYRKLPAEKKAIVIETYYLNEMKLPVASKQIFNFYFNDRKN